MDKRTKAYKEKIQAAAEAMSKQRALEWLKKNNKMKNYTIADLIKENKKQLKEYRALVQQYEDKGHENWGYEDIEYYGAYLGKVELLETIIDKLEKINLVK